MTMPRGEAGPLAELFNARAVAVIGASQSMDTINGRPIKYLLKYGYRGRIYPVSPRYQEIAGLRAYKSVLDIPDPVDLAIVAVASSRVLSVLQECAAKGIRTLIVFSSGYAELGKEGCRAQLELCALARQHGMRICGPNSMGTMNLHSGLMATFSAVLERTHRPGSIGLISQSGAYGAYILAQARELKLGFSLFATTGNEGDIEFSEVLEHVIRDPNTVAALGYVEQLRDGDAFVRAARTALERRRPVVIIKVGRSDAGIRAAYSHTGALAGSYASYEAVFRQHGIIAVNSVQDMLDIAQLLEQSVAPVGRRVGILSLSGGAAVLLADAAEGAGLEVPTLPADVQARLKHLIPFASVANPIDATAQIFNQPDAYVGFLEAMVDQTDTDFIIVFFGQLISYVPDLGLRLVNETVQAAKRSGKPVIMVGMPGEGAAADALRAGGIPHFEDPSRAVRAITALVDHLQRRDSLNARLSRLTPPPAALPRVATRNEAEAKAFLASCGVRVTRERIATTADEAAAIAREIGFPVAVKVSSSAIPHKTEVGGVELGINDATDVERAFRDIIKRVGDRNPGAPLDGVLVQEMVSAGTEMIVGAKQDEVFGPMVLCGMGGILAEILKDFALRRAPVDRETAAEMVRELRGYPVLEGARGRSTVDVGALIEIIVRISEIAVQCRDWMTEMEINPLVVLPRGRGCVAVDALIKARDAGE